MTIQTVPWLAFALFMLHELEEIALVRPWTVAVLRKPNTRAAANPFVARYRDKRGETLALVIAEETLVILGIFLLADLAGIVAALTAFCAAYLLHLLGHIAESVRARGYTPGVVTAIATAPPFGWFLVVTVPYSGWTEIAAWTGIVVALMWANFALIHWMEPRVDRLLDTWDGPVADYQMPSKYGKA